jgi:signal transduction histidine kinase
VGGLVILAGLGQLAYRDDDTAYFVAIAALFVAASLIAMLLYVEDRRARLLRVIDVLDELIAWVSHESANSATRMGMHVQLIRDGAESPRGQAQGPLAALERERESMRRSTEAILRLASTRLVALGVGGEKYEVRALNLLTLVDEAADFVELRAQEKRIGIAPRLECACIAGDAGLISIMALNLLENAVKYTPEGGRVEVACRTEQSRVLLIVEDSGPGVPEAMRDRIFLPGQRLSETESERGSGFGLALVREIVQLHRGRICVGAAALGGAPFELSFPALK